MKIDKYIITYSEVDRHLNDSVFNFMNYSSLLNANRIYDVLKSNNDFYYQRRIIENWENYELDTDDLTQEIFSQYLLYDLPQGNDIILFTDEGILNHFAFIFDSQSFFNFSNIYETYFSMEFFQLSYYCVICPKVGKLKFLDEGGGVNEYAPQRPQSADN